MELSYTDERNAQIVIALLKAHNIRKVVASPGTTNACFIASIQNDDYFEVYSAAEERSAGYIACGMAAESGEPVVLSCTGATSSRNYMPAMTEAYYRKLPILAITSSRRNIYIGHNFDQVTDRTQLPNDVAKMSVQLPLVHDRESEWACMIDANKAMLELRHHGGGPVHINLETNYSQNKVKKIEPVRAIYRYVENDELPSLTSKRIAIVVGAHNKWSERLTNAVNDFCKAYNAVVVCDHISNYRGKYRVFPNIVTHQKYYTATIKNVDVVIHIGEITSSVYGINAKEVWRVCPDGELRDTFKKLKYVFELEEYAFFEKYASMVTSLSDDELLNSCKNDEQMILQNIPDMPLSNTWIASVTADKIPENSTLHLGIRNSLRVWSFFDTKDSVLGYSNTGGFGIDGSMSAVIGASFANADKLHFCVLGDLAFFYDINSLGNRHLGNNIRILLINNGTGMEMRFAFAWGHKIATSLGIDENEYISASGHYGNKSSELVKHFTEDLGFKYMSATSKDEYLEKINEFVDCKYNEKPIVFEVFVNAEDEDVAIEALSEIKKDQIGVAKQAIKGIFGEKGFNTVKNILKK